MADLSRQNSLCYQCRVCHFAAPDLSNLSTHQCSTISGYNNMPVKGYEKITGVEDNEQPISHPLSTANIFSVLTFSWMDSILRTGRERPLEQSDFLPLHENDRTRELTEHLKNQWDSDVDRSNKEGTKPKLWKSVLKIIPLRDICVTWLLILLESVGRIMQPLLVGVLVHFLRTANEDRGILYLFAALMFSNGLLYLLSHSADFYLDLLGMKLRSALQGIIYHKIILISQQSLQEASTGHVIDLISNDLQRIEQLPLELLKSLTSLIELPVILYLMVYLAGWQALMGVVLLLATTPYIFTIASLCAEIRRQIAEDSDRRILLMDELVSGIRVLKMHGWEGSYRERVKTLRRKEIWKIFKKSAFLATIEPACFVVGVAATFISAMTIILTGHTLTPENAFMLLAFMYLLRRTVTFRLTNNAPLVFESFVSLTRTQNFLLLQNQLPFTYQDSDQTRTHIYGESANEFKRKDKDDEIEVNPVVSAAVEQQSTEIQTGLTVSSVTCHLKGSCSKCLLCQVSFVAPARSLTVVTGPVGSGKSALLSSIAGEVAITSGEIVYSGNIAYVPQEAWVFSGSIRENILFGKSYDKDKFAKVLEVCDLQEDIHRLPRGDLTFVGERGVVLSGGQQARVSLARAVYSDADVYLLDDPLSAVDATVGERIFSKCICQQLHDKVKVLVSYDRKHMKAAHQVLVMDKGSLLHKGTFLKLEQENALDQILDFVGEKREGKRMRQDSEERDAGPIKTTHPAQCDGGAVEHLDVSEEDRAIGKISFKLYWNYFRAGTHPIAIFAVTALFLVTQAAMSSPDVWLSYLTKMPLSYQRSSTTLSIYAGLVCGSFLLGFVSAFVFFHVSLRLSERLHDNMVTSVLHAAVLFFDTNPAGRILNRFSQDVGCMDEALPVKFLFCIRCFLLFCVGVLVPTVANVWLLLITVPFVVSFVYMTNYYLRTSRELKRLESICRSPVFSHFSETMAGLDTIRSQKMENYFIHQFYRHQDEHNQVFSMVMASGRWLGVRMDILCSLFVGLAAAACVVISQDAAVAGLTLVYVFITVEVGQYAVRQFSEVENLMTSAERVMTYTNLDSEPGYDNVTSSPCDWSRDGSISFRNVSLRYYPGGPYVLKNLSFDIQGKKKVGIMGRTGDGKSSIVAALLRMPEADGDILIDGVNIKSVSLQESRQCLSVLGQTPVLFSGSVRNNLDPLARHSDGELWAVLQTVQLKALIESLSGKLNYELCERGENFSVGERQLMCLARTLLQQREIVILDEPTAHVDPNTERTIWNIVHGKLENSTVITIAHRLNTIRNSDMIIVMRDGAVAERGTFDDLLGREGGVLYNMAASKQST